MLFKSPAEFHDAPRHAVTVFGMAGVGKTRLAALLRKSQWFHYSVDYRIGTRHMGEFITDNFKAEAMKVGFLRDLLRTDSIKIASQITFAVPPRKTPTSAISPSIFAVPITAARIRYASSTPMVWVGHCVTICRIRSAVLARTGWLKLTTSRQ